MRTEIAGTLLRFSVAEGDVVAVGDEIAVIESMKMEIPVEAPLAGTIERLNGNVGDFADEGTVVAHIAEA